jgi:hypothetical protein
MRRAAQNVTQDITTTIQMTQRRIRRGCQGQKNAGVEVLLFRLPNPYARFHRLKRPIVARQENLSGRKTPKQASTERLEIQNRIENLGQR